MHIDTFPLPLTESLLSTLFIFLFISFSFILFPLFLLSFFISAYLSRFYALFIDNFSLPFGSFYLSVPWCKRIFLCSAMFSFTLFAFHHGSSRVDFLWHPSSFLALILLIFRRCQYFDKPLFRQWHLVTWPHKALHRCASEHTLTLVAKAWNSKVLWTSLYYNLWYLLRSILD